jgi:hypothetical protein
MTDENGYTFVVVMDMKAGRPAIPQNFLNST